MYTIDADYNIYSNDTAAAVREDVVNFASEASFAQATAGWTLPQFVDLWNSFAGTPHFGALRGVAKFTDRKTAIRRIWIQIANFGASVEAPVTPEASALVVPEASGDAALVV